MSEKTLPTPVPEGWALVTSGRTFYTDRRYDKQTDSFMLIERDEIGLPVTDFVMVIRQK